MRYRTIVADPPWTQKGGPLDGPEFFGGANGASKDLPYPTMTLDEIRELPVAELAERDAHLYLWTTNAYVEHSYSVVRAWGFKPSTLLVWAKNAMGGGLGGAWGITTEFVLYARRGQLDNKGRHVGTWFNVKRPYRADGKPDHSRKPDAFLDMVEGVSPGPYLEMFARRQRLGWDTWGNEALNHVEMSS